MTKPATEKQQSLINYLVMKNFKNEMAKRHDLDNFVCLLAHLAIYDKRGYMNRYELTSDQVNIFVQDIKQGTLKTKYNTYE